MANRPPGSTFGLVRDANRFSVCGVTDAPRDRPAMGGVGLDGFSVVDPVLTGEQVTELVAVLEAPGEHRAGRRQPAAHPVLGRVIRSPEVLDLVHPWLGKGAFPVRMVYFDKTPTANWKVPWHQDTSIVVERRVEEPGFSAWSVKEGMVHVHAPAALLETMLTVRLHLDDCLASNGPLRVLRGSHRQGVLDEVGLRAARAIHEEVTCTVERGGAVVMRPLIVHASSAATAPGHRRVLHVEYAAGPLPGGLRWRSRATEFGEGSSGR